MEGVEDIPEAVLSEGLDFRWESFGEYLDVLAETPRVMDIGAQVPHAALRFYVMGERGADHAARPGRLLRGFQAGPGGRSHAAKRLSLTGLADAAD